MKWHADGLLQGSAVAAAVKCDFDIRLPIDGELLPALPVQRRRGRKRRRA